MTLPVKAFSLTAIILGVIGLTLGLGWWLTEGKQQQEPVTQMPEQLQSMDFRLTDHTGEEVGPNALMGRASMVFFGFTWCPDICPTTLADISGWLDALGSDANRLNVVFITVDPQRDTVDKMAEYVAAFHPAIRGWTGSPEQIDRAAEAFRVSYERVPSDNGDYAMNHTASVFLYDASGQFAGTVDYHEYRGIALSKVRRAMDVGS